MDPVQTSKDLTFRQILARELHVCFHRTCNQGEPLAFDELPKISQYAWDEVALQSIQLVTEELERELKLAGQVGRRDKIQRGAG